MSSGNSDVVDIREELRSLLTSYLTTLSLRKTVEERLRKLEARAAKSRKIRHAVSGLKTTLKHLTSREEALLRTIEAKIATSIREVEAGRDLKIKPRIVIADSDKTPHYTVTRVSAVDVEKFRVAMRDSGDVDPARAGFQVGYPKIEVVIPRLSGEVEEIITTINDIIRKFEQIKLPVHIIVKKVRTKDLELVKKLLRNCFEADGVLEVFVPGNLDELLTQQQQEAGSMARQTGKSTETGEFSQSSPEQASQS